jgi:hypothetical protein
MEHGVLAAQLATQSNCDPAVAQSMPAMAHVKPVHIWMWAHAMSHGVLPPLDELAADEATVVVALELVGPVVPVGPVVTCPPPPPVPVPVPPVAVVMSPPQPQKPAMAAPSPARITKE